jgi:branched-chain amino acid transport system substrate-binding protein
VSHQLETTGQLDRRQVLRIFGAVAALGATGSAAACAPASSADQVDQPSGRTINVGLISPALGPYAKMGDDIQKGFNLYLADHGGLLGRHKVNLKTAEEGPTPESASAAVKGLLDSNVIALAGLANPAALAAVAGAVNEAKVPLVTTSASPPSLTSAFYVWRASNVEGEAGEALAPWARVQGEKAYLFYEDTSTGRADASAFRSKFIDLGGRVVGESAGKVSFSTRMQSANALGADIIFAAHTGPDALALLNDYRTANLSVKLVGPGGLTETADLTKLTKLPSNVYTAMYYAADLDNDANRRFVSSYYKAHGVQPSGFAMAAYDSASVLDKALRLVPGIPNGAELNKAFSSLGQIESPRGTWTFNANRGPQQKWYLRRLRLDGMVPANLLDTDLEVLT